MSEHNAGRPSDAIAVLSRALDILDRAVRGGAEATEADHLRVRTLQTLSHALFDLARDAEADEKLGEAMALAHRIGDDKAIAHCHYQKALVAGRSGDLRTAAREMATVMPHLDAFTPTEQASVFLTRGMLFAEELNPARAADAFEQAGRIADRAGARRFLFMAKHDEGYVRYVAGDVPNALRLMDEASRIDADVSRGPALLDRARVLLDAGMLSEADDVLAEAERVGRDGGQHHLVSEVLLERTRCRFLMGDLDSADMYASEAYTAFRDRDAPSLADRARILVLQSSLMRGEDPSDVAMGAAEVATGAAGRGDVDLETFARTLSAEAWLATARVDDAAAQVAAVPRTEVTTLRNTLHTAYVHARLDVARNDPDRARREVRAAAANLARGQAASASLDLRAARALHGVRLAQLDLDLAVDLGPEAVLEALETWRTATEHLPTIRPPHDPATARLYEQLRTLRSRLRQTPDAPGATDWRHAAEDLERRLRERDWSNVHPDGVLGDHDSRGGFGKDRLDAFRDALDAQDRDLLTFFPHNGRMWGLAVIHGRIEMGPLAPLGHVEELARRIRADVRVAMHQGYGPLRGAILGSLAANVASVDELLVMPWDLGDTGLVIVPTSHVASMPWGLVPSLRQVPVTVSQSLAAYVKRLPAQRASDTGPITRVHVGVGPELARARDEVAAVADVWSRAGGKISQSSERADLVRALTFADIVHVAAHGTHEQDSPLFSTLLMSDGHLFAHELQPSGITSPHVVLSACEVGATTVRPGEEALGMAATLLSLGASCVVAPVAPVPDELAVATMDRYHHALVEGRPTDEALADAVATTDPLAGVFVSTGSTWRVPARGKRGPAGV